ncbi:MAG TPA: ABC transporter permease [Longimicrobiales bacterium]|nr:ABC transporter permease [Longimicrobiales bacterium]
MKQPGAWFALHRLLLRLHPGGFRRRHGREVLRSTALALAADRRAGRGTAPAWLRTLGDLAANVVATRADAVRREGRGLPRAAGRALGGGLASGPRRLIRSPGFTVPALVSLGLGMGAATAAWTLVDAAFLRPLPYPEAQDLVVVHSTRAGEGISVSYPDFLDWQAEAQGFESLGAFTRSSRTLTGDGPAEVLRGLLVSSDLFPALGIEPALGRAFGPEDDVPGAERRVLITDALWTGRFGGDPGVLGRTLRLDGEPFVVSGVLPPGFAFPDGVVLGASDLYLPMGLAAGRDDWQDRSSHPGLYVVGRLSPGVGVDRARAELTRVAEALASRHPDTNAEEGVVVRSLRDVLVGDMGSALVFLAVAGGLVLVISWANVTGLFLARLSVLRRDVGVRSALGATRGRLAGLFLGESLWLGLGSAALGAGVALAALRMAGGEISTLPGLDAPTLDVRLLATLVALTLATAAAVGVTPALRAGAGVERAPSAGPGAGSGRLRDGLVVAEVGLAVLLLFTGALLGRSFLELAGQDGGLRTEGVATFRLALPEPEDPVGLPTIQGYGEVEARLRALPGVTAVGGISTLPFSGAGSQSGVGPADAVDDSREIRTDVNVVTPGYFDAVELPLVRGRTFTDADGPGAPVVVLVDTRFAERVWPGEDPLGKRVRGWGLQEGEVVGVVEHVRNYGVLRESREELYMAHGQRPYIRMSLFVRTEGDPATLSDAVRREVAAVLPDVPVQGYIRFRDVERATLSRPRLAAGLGLALALLAAVLAVSGVYALMAFAVARRTRELGVRMAVGASSAQVRGMVLRRAARRVAVGSLVGIAGALLVAGLLEGLVHGAAPRDPLSLVLAVGFLGVAGLTAAAIPAWRASRVDPARVLRED